MDQNPQPQTPEPNQMPQPESTVPEPVPTVESPAFTETPAQAPLSVEPVAPEVAPGTAEQPMSVQPAVPAQNPGQTLGIVSIVLDFIGLGLVGAILGGISRNKSKAAGASTTLGTVGMVLGIIFTVLGIIWGIFMVIMIGFMGAQQKARSEAAFAINNDATTVAQNAEYYYGHAGSYPASVSDFEKYSDSSLKSLKDVTIVSSTPGESQVEYKRCSPGKAFVSYLDPSTNQVQTTPLGISSEGETVSC